MKIIIVDGYYIDVDEHNYTLKHEYAGRDKDGNPKKQTKPLGHYTTLEHALTNLARMKVLNNHDEITLSKYIKELNKTNDELIELVQGETKHL